MAKALTLCSDCPPDVYPTDRTRCGPCPRRKKPLSAHATKELRNIAKQPVPCCGVNAGVSDKLLREGLVVVVSLTNPFPTRKHKEPKIPHLAITGRGLEKLADIDRVPAPRFGPEQPRLSDKAVGEIEKSFDNTREAHRLLELINSEFTSDPMSVQCFDLRVVADVRTCVEERKRLVKEGVVME